VRVTENPRPKWMYSRGRRK